MKKVEVHVVSRISDAFDFECELNDALRELTQEEPKAKIIDIKFTTMLNSYGDTLREAFICYNYDPYDHNELEKCDKEACEDDLFILE